MKTWDVAIVGGGVIGMSLARALRKHGAAVLVVERGEPGREASHAAAGMLADADHLLPPALQPLAVASGKMYPEFVHELEDESGLRVDLRRDGAIAFFPAPPPRPWSELPQDELAQMEPRLANLDQPAWFAPEASLDVRVLMAALLKAAKHRGIEVAQGAAATEVEVTGGRATAVKTAKTKFVAGVIVNCAGAWAGQLPPLNWPTKPIKGQMLCVIAPGVLRHVVRSPEVYLVPRSDGRVLIGSTLEDAGFDKRVLPDVVQRLHQAAANLVPELGQAKMLEAWAGLRPGTPDELPILGRTEVEGCFVAAGHYRDGILLAPVTAHLMEQVVRGAEPGFPLQPFSPQRFR